MEMAGAWVISLGVRGLAGRAALLMLLLLYAILAARCMPSEEDSSTVSSFRIITLFCMSIIFTRCSPGFGMRNSDLFLRKVLGEMLW